ADAEIRYLDLLGLALPAQRLTELVEFRLVGEARHVHEALLVGRAALLKDGVASGLEIVGVGDAGFDARLVRGHDGDEERTEAVAEGADALRIDLRPRHQPID